MKLIAALQQILIKADFKTVEKKFTDQGIESETVKHYLEDFKKLRDSRDLGENKDIELWGKKPWQEFQEFVDKTKEEKSKSEEKKLQRIEGAELVHEDDEWLVYKILTHEASVLYGSGTKWCITQKNGTHWKHYTNRNKNCFYFLISKTRDKDDKFYKIAAMRSKRGDLTFFDALDVSYSSSLSLYQQLDPALPKIEYSFFETKPQDEERTVDAIAGDIQDLIENLEENRRNPEENDSTYYLYEQLDFNDILKSRHVEDTVKENLKHLNNLCDSEDFDLGNIEEIIKDELTHVEISDMYYNTNEIASMGLGEEEYELDSDDDLTDEINSLSEEDYKELDRAVSIRKHTRSGGNNTYTIYYGDTYDRFVLILDEDKLDAYLTKLGEVMCNKCQLFGDACDCKEKERVLATGFDDVDKQNYEDYHSLIERLDDVIEILERAKPEKWSIARRHDVREYIDKHFKAANKKFWDKVGKLSSTIDPTDKGSTAPYEVKDRPYKY